MSYFQSSTHAQGWSAAPGQLPAAPRPSQTTPHPSARGAPAMSHGDIRFPWRPTAMAPYGGFYPAAAPSFPDAWLLDPTRAASDQKYAASPSAYPMQHPSPPPSSGFYFSGPVQLPPGTSQQPWEAVAGSQPTANYTEDSGFSFVTETGPFCGPPAAIHRQQRQAMSSGATQRHHEPVQKQGLEQRRPEMVDAHAASRARKRGAADISAEHKPPTDNSQAGVTPSASADWDREKELVKREKALRTELEQIVAERASIAARNRNGNGGGVGAGRSVFGERRKR